MGATLLQAHQTIGGARSVFVKLEGHKNELVFLPHGGKLKNPFNGAAKIFAGDLFEYRTDTNGENPELYLLKTYKVKSQSSTKVVIYKDGYKHIPFVGDVLMKAPSAIGGTGKAYTVSAVAVNTEGNWELTFSTAIDTVVDGDILVEAEAASATGTMLVKNINAVASCDYDCFYAPASGDADFDGARYHLNPIAEAVMFIHKMSPLPACVLALNQSNVNGWFMASALRNNTQAVIAVEKKIADASAA